ncbi:MAG: hypothetical protein HOM14_18325 [Gammaproteobacteria bacterium]|jgi:hypothetical protein|nr:hypothetical protein [Gammaproteobacteria bacterium]MBT6226132.1 hypothetical protein [Candidatus Scalindua sp.]MBT4193898.1 hypothetical protein [Gammaproteobacteria bacterium]MBT4451532.1 hypothetical protein [Gammaproteobacteria bacterium]MBT4861324.1 hypothetical protein [Gammaproteobacteria bacterium]
MGIFNWKNKATDPQQPHTTQTVNYAIPYYRIIRVRMFWIILFFILGATSQFLLAVYIPDLWNYIYGVFAKNAPPL